ncbi:MAG TPA: cytochrome c-type biogenesis CcmF C-terminal domain-containing protein, partial [Herminiimonas sp.]|nr:cytochrome c-type biogenesis CcmF C-terminal domain-containing protein [Herminiimonas sp.]
RVQHKPFVSWIWAGCLIIAFGGFLAASDRRYRMGSRKKVAKLADNASIANPTLIHTPVNTAI